MNKQVFAALSLSLGLSLAISSASCDTCPRGQQSCGDSNPGAAGDSSSETASCGLLTAFRTCMTAYCKTTSNPFCTCYKRGYDLTTNGCVCIDFDAKKYCDQADANGNDGSSYDCAADSSRISSFCVPVTPSN